MIRVGIIGLGFGAAVHLPAFRAVPGVRIAALGGRGAEKARRLAAASGIDVGGSIEELLQTRLDVVSIALPPAEGAVVAERALDLGIAVLAEKPLAESMPRAAALVRKAKGRIAAVDFELGELDSFQELKRRIATEDVRTLDVKWHARSYTHERKVWSWKVDRAAHGGVMTLLGSHVLYMVEWLLGPLTELTARFSDERTRAFAPAGAQPAEDRSQISAVTKAGVRVEIELDNASGGSGQRWDADLGGGRRLVLAETAGGAFALSDGSAPLAADTPAPGRDWRIEPVRRLAARFVAAVASNADCQPDFVAGARVQRLLEAARESAARARAVNVN
jgi:predicted dehydrogenase